MQKKVAILGLGYVGLPLAVALAKKGHEVFGYDISESRIKELRKSEDRTLEVDAKDLCQKTLHFVDTPEDISTADIFIVTVPTPIDTKNQPDITALKEASKTVGRLLKNTKGKIVIFESTVYPGLTEEICGQILEDTSYLTAGKDFFLGYAPERMNPGDKNHHLHNITKVVAAQTEEVAKDIATLYGQINGNNVFIAKDIATAEAAKVIENAQRDINIAFMNEVSMIFSKMGISIYDVLEAANTKWNFLPFTPGLVGGHCIGVDPYYLAQCAKNLGHHPDVILAGRHMNNSMSAFIAKSVSDQLKDLKKEKAKILVLGLTFKENVPDMRNSKVQDLVFSLKEAGHDLTVVDPFACAEKTRNSMGVVFCKSIEECKEKFDAIILAVGHDVFKEISIQDIKNILKTDGKIFDIKGFWRQGFFEKENIEYWCL